MKLEGSVVLVTGANRGLGRAFVQALQVAGARKIYAGARDPRTLDLRDIEPVRLDITNAQDVAAAARDLRDVTLLINNAGIWVESPFVAESGDAARVQMETNYFGTLAVCRAIAPHLKTNGGGAIVNVLSALSWAVLPGTGPYSASKAAELALTKGLRLELHDQGTLVVAVHAGYIDTEMAKSVSAPKVAPQDVAKQVLEAVLAEREEVLADDVSRRVKSSLSAASPGAHHHATQDGRST